MKGGEVSQIAYSSQKKMKYRNSLVQNLRKLRVLGDIGRNMAGVLLEKERSTLDYLISKKFTQANLDTIIEKRDFDSVRLLENLDHYKGIDHTYLIDKYLKTQQGELLAKYHTKLSINPKSLAEKLIPTEAARSVFYYFDYKDWNLDDLLVQFMRAKKYITILSNHDKIPCIDFGKLIEKVVEEEGFSNLALIVHKLDAQQRNFAILTAIKK